MGSQIVAYYTSYNTAFTCNFTMSSMQKTRSSTFGICNCVSGPCKLRRVKAKLEKVSERLVCLLVLNRIQCKLSLLQQASSNLPAKWKLKPTFDRSRSIYPGYAVISGCEGRSRCRTKVHTVITVIPHGHAAEVYQDKMSTKNCLF